MGRRIHIIGICKQISLPVIYRQDKTFGDGRFTTNVQNLLRSTVIVGKCVLLHVTSLQKLTKQPLENGKCNLCLGAETQYLRMPFSYLQCKRPPNRTRHLNCLSQNGKSSLHHTLTPLIKTRLLFTPLAQIHCLAKQPLKTHSFPLSMLTVPRKRSTCFPLDPVQPNGEILEFAMSLLCRDGKPNSEKFSKLSQICICGYACGV